MSTVKFIDNSKKVKADVLKQRDIALVEAAVVVQGECIARCPVDTGRLRGSIGYITGSGLRAGGDGTLQGSPAAGEAVVGTNVEYAAHVEYGTRFTEAQAFMRTGFDASRKEVDGIFKRRLRAEAD
ncbi:HK97-gp10 family putative phage morphogenesis protein [uncultured Sphaerochaeta sp.]|uniref:HK97-gp10 family putative phage morphogenesis protein n=1 Tax=uncultured Sphaerochaeta sp. TaxID=886478 RepID=UPI0029CA8F4A|nr:HK97-gp10 family putative phage morphogenesis protein [uncultured Sphaerochaeta sp.]